MASTSPPAYGGIWIRQARLRADLTQKELAERLDTSQSLIARWEGGVVEPGFATVVQAVRACGLELAVSVTRYDSDHDLMIKENLKLSPTERLGRMQDIRRQFEKLSPRTRTPDATTP